MHSVSVIKTLVFGLLASTPLAAAFTAGAGTNEVEKRHLVSNHPELPCGRRFG